MGSQAGVLRFEANVPELIALQFSEGKEMTSQYDNPDGSPRKQYLFTLVDGRRAFVPPIVADKIRDAGIGARQPFEICKRVKGSVTRWEVNTQNERADAGTPAPATIQTLNQYKGMLALCPLRLLNGFTFRTN
jgi:hypothetical protein